MTVERITRRYFAGAVSAAVGGALLEPLMGDSIALASISRGDPPDVIQLNSNENPEGPSPRALEAIRKAGDLFSRYPDARSDDVRDAIAHHHGVAPGQIVLGCGSSEILRMADMAFLGPGRTLVSAEPTFEAVLLFAGVTKAEAIKVPLTADFIHDLPRMAAACDEKTGLVYVCNANNPTGTIVTGEEMAAFLARVPAATTVLVDEAYHDFVESSRYRSAIDFLGRHPNIVVARTFSKIYGMAGMRLGYAVASEANAQALERHTFFNNVNGASLEAALASLTEPGLVAKRRKASNDTRRWLVAQLEKDGRRSIPSETNFVMIDVGREVSAVIAALRERKILAGRKFSSMPNWLRISIGKREEMEAFLRGLRAIVPSSAAA